MNKIIQNAFVFIAFCLVGYIVFRSMGGFREGMTGDSSGVAGNAATYASSLTAQSVQMQDAFLISKYRTDYENVIINMTDLVNNLMLQTVLSANVSQPQSIIETLTTLNTLNGSQVALNNVMKFIDGN